MKPQMIIFDLDDTLIHCNKYFRATINEFSTLLFKWMNHQDISIEIIKSKQHHFDTSRVLESGLSPENFPLSFLDTYEFYCRLVGRRRTSEEEETLLELGHSVYNHPVEAMPYMEQTLMELQNANHSLHLFTGGVPEIQQRKIEEACLLKFFSGRIHVSRHKTTSALNQIIDAHQLDRKNTWMIGNSIRSDIVPALESGLNCIFIPAKLEWEFNNVEVTTEPQGIYQQLDSLVEVPPLISQFTIIAANAVKAINR